jgi:hypothetical protein
MEQQQGRNLVKVEEQYRMKPPVPPPRKRYHESKDASRILQKDTVGTTLEECQRDLALLLERNTGCMHSSTQQHNHQCTKSSIEETLGRVFAEHVGRKHGSGTSSALAEQAQQALKTMASVMAPPGSGRTYSTRDYITALGALIASYDARGRIDVDSAFAYVS